MNPLLKALRIEVREFCVDNFVLKQIDEIFVQGDFPRQDYSSSYPRRSLVEDYYRSMDWEQKDTIDNFYQVIRTIVKTRWLSDELINDLIYKCRELGFNVQNCDQFYSSADLFVHQFPVGLPFGKKKPSVVIKAEQGSQDFKFEWQEGIGIIKHSVYPSLTFRKLASAFGCTPETDGALRRALRDMNQTDWEKQLFLKYANGFKMADTNIPVLIPQAWIQWHSLTKKYLSSNTSLHPEDIYRVDFVAFWNNKRFAIQVDDISHYAVESDNKWLADEESYSRTLKDERDLRKQDWQVFRVSNWEIKNDDKLELVLDNLKDFLGF